MESAAMSDDGEPSGTAGKPILNVIQHKSVRNVIVVVTRYFGGIKLGAGGLVRAYSRAAEQAMSLLEIKEVFPQVRYSVTAPFGLEQDIRHLLTTLDGQVLDVNYTDQITLIITLNRDAKGAFLDYCARQQLAVRELEGY